MDFAFLTGMEYLVDCRIQLAARYLLERQLSVSDISEVVSYRSKRAFTTGDLA